MSGPSFGRSASPASKRSPSSRSSFDERAVLLVGEPVDDVLRPVRPEALCLGDLLRCRGHEPVDGSEVAGEGAREHPADPGDVEAEQNPRERDVLRALDRLDRRARGDLREALDLEELLLREAVEVGQRPDEALLPEDADRLLADAVDVGDARPVDERLEAAGRACAVRAAVHRLALGLDDSDPHNGQCLGIRNSFVPRWCCPGRPDDLRDDVAGALDDDVVAGADAFAVDVLLVVERRPRDRDAADLVPAP